MDFAALAALTPAREIVDPNEAAENAWHAKRNGRFTASNFAALIGEGRGKDSKFTQTGYSYIHRKAAERLGSWHSVYASSMQWGNDNEADAIDAYRKRSQLVVDSRPYQFYIVDDHIGGTPDGMVQGDGCLEVKCPFDPAVHVGTAIRKTVPTNYIWQVHGHMLCTGRKWCDFVSFDPRIQDESARLVVIRVDRDEDRLKFLRERLALAVVELNSVLNQLKKAD